MVRGEMLGRPFSVRQLQILELLVAGLLNKEIAHKLHLSEGTIKVFMSVIFAKSGMTNRTELAVWWVRRGMTQ